jgi:hypothetical protein
MPVELELTIGFSVTGNSLGYLGGGWARAEPDFTWAVGGESHLILQRSKLPGDSVLTLDVIPFIHEPELPAQRLTVSVNDTVVGSSLIYRPSLLGYRIPADLMRRGERILVTLVHPDAARPVEFPDGTDDRNLAFSITEAKLYRITEGDAANGSDLPVGLMMSGASNGPADGETDADLTQWVQDRTGLTLPQLAIKFESLGENCEFGLVQRRCESEPLGLLRFSSTFLRNLIRGLDSGFEGLGVTDEIDPRLEGPGPVKEFMIHEKRYGLIYHTFVYDGQRSVWLMREQEAARLKFLRRKFMEELEAAEKIFVYKRNAEVSEEEILPLFLALNRYGANRLLWVVPADDLHPPGTVEVAPHGILKGYIDRFAPDENAHDFSFEGWIRLCANAHLLSKLKKKVPE